MKDILFVIIMLAPMVAAGAFKIWPLFWVLLIFNCIFGVIEVVSKKMTGKTVSQYFWEFSKQHKIKAIIMLVSMGLMWTALLIHLGGKF